MASIGVHGQHQIALETALDNIVAATGKAATFAPSPPPTPGNDCLTLTMNDKYGDGWNSAYYTWVSDDTEAVVQSGTLQTSHTGTATVPIAPACATL